MAHRPIVHVTGPIPKRVGDALASEFDVGKGPIGADGILALVTTNIDSRYLDQAGPQLRVIANYGVGVDNIDLGAAFLRGITVTNTPDVLTKATAEFAIALMLSLVRRVTEGDRFLRTRQPWKFDLELMLGEGLEGKGICIIGPGRIGREAARLVQAFGAKPLLVRRTDDLYGSLATADVVSIHCPLTADTWHLIDEVALGYMRDSAVLVNTARGPIVDERALISALDRKWIAGAALDVHEFEPRVSEDLLRMENVVVTPHLGSGTRATREAMGYLALESLREVLLYDRAPKNAVEVAGPRGAGSPSGVNVASGDHEAPDPHATS